MAWIKSLKPKGGIIHKIKQIMVSHESKDSRYPPHPAAARQIAKLNLVSGEVYPVPYGSLLNKSKEEGPIGEEEIPQPQEAAGDDGLVDDSEPLLLCTWEIGRDEPLVGLSSSLCHATKSVHDTQAEMLEKRAGLEEKIKIFQETRKKAMEAEKREVIRNVKSSLRSIYVLSLSLTRILTLILGDTR